VISRGRLLVRLRKRSLHGLEREAARDKAMSICTPDPALSGGVIVWVRRV
jgi:hypothetical protein